MMVRRITSVVKNNIRKANTIKKYESSYYVAIGHIGLMELCDKTGDHTQYEGYMEGEGIAENRGNNITIPVSAKVRMEIETMVGGDVRLYDEDRVWGDELDDYLRDFDGFLMSYPEYSDLDASRFKTIAIYNRESYPNDLDVDYVQQLRRDYEDWKATVSENMKGVQRVLIDGRLDMVAGVGDDRYEKTMEFRGYESIEDFTGAVSEAAESICFVARVPRGLVPVGELRPSYLYKKTQIFKD